jgi:hypothetical protein
MTDVYLLRNLGGHSPDIGGAGQYLQSYHDTPDGRGAATFTTDPAMAKTFDSFEAAMRFWRRQSITKPLRPDGKPNCPLTAMHATVETLAKALEQVPMPIMVGGSPLDKMFTITTDDEGEVSWNVTKLEAAAERGEFGPAHVFPTADLAAPCYDNVDRVHIERIKGQPETLDKPIIGIGRVCRPGETAIVRCIVDGNHRIIARQELKLPDFSMWIVPPEIERQFRCSVRMEGSNG